MVVVGQRIAVGDKLGGVHHERRLPVGLGEEIVAIVGVGIAGAPRGLLALPTHGAFGVEQAAVADHRGSHLGQIVGGGKITFAQLLVLEVATIAEDAHATQVAETRLARQLSGQLIDARLGDANLHPASLAQDGVLRIDGRILLRRRVSLRSRTRRCFQRRFGLGSDGDHEGDEKLQATLTAHNGAEREVEASLLAVHDDVLLYLGQSSGISRGGQGEVSERVSPPHVEKLGVAYFERVDAVRIVLPQGDGIAETGQHRVDGNVVNSQIEESLLLRLALQTAEEGENQQYGVAEYFHTILI